MEFTRDAWQLIDAIESETDPAQLSGEEMLLATLAASDEVTELSVPDLIAYADRAFAGRLWGRRAAALKELISRLAKCDDQDGTLAKGAGRTVP